MDYLSRYMVIGLILLSSLSAFAEDGSPAPASGGTIPSVDTSQEIGKTPDGGEGNDPNKIVQPIKGWRAPLASCQGVEVKAKPILDDIDKNAKTYQESQVACKEREDKANRFCLESRNPDIKNFIGVAQVLMAGVSGMMDACSKFGKAMDLGNKALTAYQTMCSSWRGYCNSACGDAVKSVKAIQSGKEKLSQTVVQTAQEIAKAKATTDPAGAARCTSLASSYPQVIKDNDEAINAELKVSGDYKAVAQKYETCKGYAKELATAAIGGISMLNSMSQANKCEKDTKSDNPTTAAGSTAVDCTIPENKKNKMECICQDNPRMAGCNTGLDSATMAKSGDGLRAAGGGGEFGGDTKAPGNLDLGGGDGQDLQAKATDGSGGSSLPGAPSGGGGGLGGGSGGFGGGVDGTTAKKPNSLNTNILGGEGGGGGGGGWGGYGSDRDPALRQYLPGGAKDPNAAGMAGAAMSKQVTSQGGKSNWEKIKDRYRDNKPTLLGY